MVLSRRRLLFALASITPATAADFAPLLGEAARAKRSWRPMLEYLANLHRRGTHPPQPPFPYEWEEIGTGYQVRAFGHWDIVHQILDVLPAMPEHALNQLRNNVANQQDDGMIPGAIRVEIPHRDPPRWHRTASHPPLWPLAVEAWASATGAAIPEIFVSAAKRQIAWFEANRAARPIGAWYTRVHWESGIDDDLRQPFGDATSPRQAFLDATCHLFGLYDAAARWSGEASYRDKANAVRDYVRGELFDARQGCFYDAWAVRDPRRRVESFVTIWPLVYGLATNDQAASVIDRHLLNPRRFFAEHPIRTVARDDPKFDLLMWRGPSWNSMTYWAARGCLRYGRRDAARKLAEAALDSTAHEFARTGTIWEFYHPDGGPPESLRREVVEPFGTPRRDYAGHNPLFALARLAGRSPARL